MEEGEVRNRFGLKSLGIVVIAALVAGAIAGAAVNLIFGHSKTVTSTGSAPSALEHRVLTSEENAVSDAVQRALPSVVTIINDQGTGRDSQGNLVQNLSSGSGVIVDDRGFIVTNEHVIHNPGKLTVILNGGEERTATPVSDDAPFTDLAVIRIPAGGLQALKFGDSSALKLGQTVIAIGSPLFDFQNSVSIGVVSGVGRKYLRENVYLEDLIQTDAAINNGNSGGPLLTTDGTVVGLNTTVVRRIGSQDIVVGISFALSSRRIEPIVSAIIQRGQYPRPYIGIIHVDIDASLAQSSHLALDHGALIRRVVDASPAQAAGLQVGDIILKIGDSTLGDDLPYLNALGRLKPGDKVDIQYSRAGKVQDALVGVSAR